MTEFQHNVDTKWREADAAAYEERVMACAFWIAHTDDLLELFEGETEILKELRSVAGRIREKSNDLSERAGKLRAALAEQNGQP